MSITQHVYFTKLYHNCILNYLTDIWCQFGVFHTTYKTGENQEVNYLQRDSSAEHDSHFT